MVRVARVRTENRWRWRARPVTVSWSNSVWVRAGTGGRAYWAARNELTAFGVIGGVRDAVRAWWEAQPWKRLPLAPSATRAK